MPDVATPGDIARFLGTFTYGKLDGSTLELYARVVSCRNAKRIQELLKSLEGKRYDDEATIPAVDEVLGLTIGDWKDADAFTPEALKARLSSREAAVLAFLAPGAVNDLEAAYTVKRGGRKNFWDARGNLVIAFEKDAEGNVLPDDHFSNPSTEA